MNKIFSIYMKYIHNLDIFLGEEQGDPSFLRKYYVRELSVVGGHQQATQGVEVASIVNPSVGEIHATAIGAGVVMKTTIVK